jgi:DNA gyrase subunit B
LNSAIRRRATPRPDADASDDSHPPANGGGARKPLHIVELHEVRSINNQLAELRKMGFEIDSLIPQERTGVEEPRYRLRRGESTTGLETFAACWRPSAAAGEKGLQVTRFKGWAK